MFNTNQDRQNWHQKEIDFYKSAKQCTHRRIKEKTVSDFGQVITYHECADCHQEL